MKHRIVGLAAIVLVLSAAAAAQGPTVNLEPQLVKTQPVPLQSGDDGDLHLKVTNNGDTTAANVTVHMQDYYPFTVKEDRRTRYNVGDVVPGESYFISTELLVAGDAPDGANPYPVRITFELAGEQRSVTKEIDVEVQSNDTELRLANIQATPSTLRPDTEDNEVSVDVVNTGDDTAENVVLDLTLPFGTEASTSLAHRHAFGNVEPGETKTGTFRFDLNASTPTGMLQFPGTLRYSGGDSREQVTTDASFRVNVEGSPLYRVTDVESDLVAGERSQVRVTVRNVGTEESASTRLRFLDDADLPFSFDSANVFIGTLDPGEDGTAVFSVRPDSDAVAKDYLLDFEARGVHGTAVFVDTFTRRITVEDGQTDQGVPLPLIGAVVLVLLAAVGYGYHRYRQED